MRLGLVIALCAAAGRAQYDWNFFYSTNTFEMEETYDVKITNVDSLLSVFVNDEPAGARQGVAT